MDWTTYMSLNVTANSSALAKGIFVDRLIVSKSLLSSWFEHLNRRWSDNSPFSIPTRRPREFFSIQKMHETFLEPLMQAAQHHIQSRKLNDADFNPSERSTCRALRLIGEMLDAFIEPFINPKLSISEQIVSCALFMKHESDFMPHHLYTDLRCMIWTSSSTHTNSRPQISKSFPACLMTTCWRSCFVKRG